MKNSTWMTYKAPHKPSRLASFQAELSSSQAKPRLNWLGGLQAGLNELKPSMSSA